MANKPIFFILAAGILLFAHYSHSLTITIDPTVVSAEVANQVTESVQNLTNALSAATVVLDDGDGIGIATLTLADILNRIEAKTEDVTVSTVDELRLLLTSLVLDIRRARLEIVLLGKLSPILLPTDRAIIGHLLGLTKDVAKDLSTVLTSLPLPAEPLI